MNLEPLIDASPAIQFHLATACTAAVLGAIVLSSRKGTLWHRVLGRGFVLTLGAAALSSFFIHELRTVGAFSAVHLLSIVVLYNLWQAIRAIRQRRVQSHRQIMMGTYFTGIIVAGGFTFLSGRLMAELTYGGSGGLFPILWLVVTMAVVWFIARLVFGWTGSSPANNDSHGMSSSPKP